MGLTDTHASTPGSTGKLRFHLERSVWCQVVAGRPSHMAGQRVERPPPTFSIDSGLSSSCKRVATKARVEPPQTLAGWPRHWAGQWDPRPTWSGV
jgi:hypothetical protein